LEHVTKGLDCISILIPYWAQKPLRRHEKKTAKDPDGISNKVFYL